MRKAILLLLSFSILTQLIAQPSNDNCSNALNLPLQTPSSCPESGELTDNFRFTNIGATPSDPFPALSGCSGEAPSSGADVWFQFNPAGNNITLTVSGGLDAPFAALFENGSEGCSGIYPVACASGAGSLELSVNVDPNNSYYLLISGGEVEDQGDFELSITTSNDCSPCVSGREGYFSVTPAPENGTYRSGQPVQMCYVVTRWDAGSGGEYLHSLELSFGPAWDQESFAPVPPPSCSGEGIWGYYDSWASSATGQDHGPGFAFDGPDFDGNPGNNLGESTIGCANIGTTAPPVSFCWTITADECITGESSIYGDLNISVRLLGDGVSGAGENTLCPDGRREDFLATLHCPDPLAPDVIAIDASCGGNCDGSLLITGGGEGPWNYTVTGPNGDVAYSSTGSTSTDTATALCPGLYTIDIFSLPAGENRRVTAGIGAPVVPVASANYTLPCVEGEPIELYGEAMPSQGASYSWSGPYGYSSSERDPLALYPGIYTLVVTVDGCPSAPFELEVPPISQTVASIAEDTLIACPGEPLTISASGNATSFTWYAGETATPIGTGPSITVNPEDGTVYRVAGTNDNGCTGFDEVLALVPFNPAITVDTSGILCPGTTLTLTATEGEQFLWSTGDSTASITASPEQSTLYSLEVTGPNGCVVQLSVFVSVANGAGIFISPDAAICEGESVSLFAGGGEVAWSTGDSVSTITVSPQQTTTYTAAITNSLGCVFSRETTVSVNPAPDIELLPSDTAYLCRGDSLQLSAFLSDTLIWDSLVAPAQTTYYPLPGAAGYGCQELAGFTVIVHPLPMVSIEGDELLCSSDSVLLVANGTGMLAWSTGENTDSIYVYPTGTETYSVTATDANGCSSTDSVQVTQAAPPEAPQVSCTTSLGQVVFTWIVEPGLTYGLSHLEGPAGIPSGNNRYVVNGLLPGQMVSIELEATNAAGCSAVTPASCSAPDCSVLSLFIGAPDEVCSDSGPVSLAAIATGGSGSGSGEWSGPGVDDTTDTFNPSLAGAGTHQLVYTYTDAGCTVSDTLQITVVQALEASMVTCDASPSTVVFSWPELPQDTAYEVAVLSGQNGSFTGPATYEVSGLSSGEEVTIEIRTLGAGACQTTSVTSTCYSAGCPVLEVSPDTMICFGNGIPLYASEDGWDSFQWSPAFGLSCTGCPNPYAAPTQTTTYTVIAANVAGCTDTAKVTVYVGEIPDSYIPDGTIYFCEGEPLEICLPDVGIPLWIGPNAFVSTERCLSFDNATDAITGNYYAILRTADCRFVKRFRLQPAPRIEVLDISAFQTVCPDEVFTLYVESPQAVSYFWSPAEYLDCPTCPATEGSVPQTATFTVELADSYGCTATDMATVFVDACQARPVLPPSTTQAAEALRFYPNPASGSVQLELPGEGIKTVQLWNSSGMLVRELRTPALAYVLPLQPVPPGTYLLRVVSEDETRAGWLVVSK